MADSKTNAEQGDGTRGDRVTDPAFSRNLDRLTLDELRARRKDAENEEQELSYVRRLLHGRIDILKAETRRRAGEGDEVMANLATILSDAPSGNRSAHAAFHSSDAPEGAERAADLALADQSIPDLATASDRELRESLDGLLEHERAVSDVRNQVHRVIDRLTSELTRRYKDGTAQVDDLLAAVKKH